LQTVGLPARGDKAAGAALAIRIGDDAPDRTSPSEGNDAMACPHLREVVMLFCDAYPVKKMLPLDRLATAEPCVGQFCHCPFFRDMPSRVATNVRADDAAAHPVALMTRKEA
jgi:hypothetical protein